MKYFQGLGTSIKYLPSFCEYSQGLLIFQKPIKYLPPFVNISQGPDIFIKLYRIFIALCKYPKRPENILKEIKEL